jgi:hypothetical protein
MLFSLCPDTAKNKNKNTFIFKKFKYDLKCLTRY